VHLLTQHIEKENNILFPMVDSSIPIVKQETLLDDFKSVIQRIISTDKLEELLDNLNSLEELYSKK
jgi:hemerythrin-like domain-containing protein